VGRSHGEEGCDRSISLHTTATVMLCSWQHKIATIVSLSFLIEEKQSFLYLRRSDTDENGGACRDRLSHLRVRESVQESRLRVAFSPFFLTICFPNKI
jgi:hypothetical protein